MCLKSHWASSGDDCQWWSPALESMLLPSTLPVRTGKGKAGKIKEVWVPNVFRHFAAFRAQRGWAKGTVGFISGSGCAWLEQENPRRPGSQHQAQRRRELAVSSLDRPPKAQQIFSSYVSIVSSDKRTYLPLFGIKSFYFVVQKGLFFH